MQILGRDILISLAIVISIMYISHKKTKLSTTYKIGITLLCITMVMVFSLTGVSPISGFNTNINLHDIEFIPFAGIIEMMKGGVTFHSIINILGNIIMFVPIGFLAPILFNKLDNLKLIAILGFCISLFIELTQLFLTRATDIDDLVLNTFGTILGYLVFSGLKKSIPEFRKKIIEQSRIIQNQFMLLACIIIPYMVIVMFGFYDRYIYFTR